MIRRFFGLFAPVIAALLVVSGSLRAEPTNSAPDFKEVYDLLRANLPGAADETLNRAAVEGLLTQLRDRVAIISASAESAESQDGAVVSKSAVLESNVAYLRINGVATGLTDKLNAAYHALAALNKVVGTVLDLRFADGNDYTVVPEVAKLFATPKIPSAIGGPLVVLVNGETRDAAESLAAGLRESGAALIIGSSASGGARTFKEFPLKNGERLRIAMTPVTSRNGSAVSRVQPDITVTTSPDDERAYFADAYAELSKPSAITSLKAATNGFLPFIDRISEADLVREKLNDNGEYRETAQPHHTAPQGPLIRDPALARALDLIKGLAVVRESHR
jgi:C-terminal processing protease CtpA/Prc